MQDEPYRRIPLRARGGAIRAFAVVDEEDYRSLGHLRWCLQGKYAARREHLGDGHYHNLFLHRAILGLGRRDPREGDHINRDKLDNRRANLRIVTRVEGAQNKSSYRGATSSYRGVHWDPRKGKWCAQVQVGYRKIGLGAFDDEATAAVAAAAARKAVMLSAVD